MGKRSWTSVESVRRRMKDSDTAAAGVLDLTLRLLEPLCYVFWYIKKAVGISSYVAASGDPTTFAGLVVKLVLRSRLVCIMHDTGFYDYGFRELSFPMRVYYSIFVHCLRYVDAIIVVSQTTMKALSRADPALSRSD